MESAPHFFQFFYSAICLTNALRTSPGLVVRSMHFIAYLVRIVWIPPGWRLNSKPDPIVHPSFSDCKWIIRNDQWQVGQQFSASLLIRTPSLEVSHVELVIIAHNTRSELRMRWWPRSRRMNFNEILFPWIAELRIWVTDPDFAGINCVRSDYGSLNLVALT